jgi:CHAT domain-containing protein
MMVRRRLCRVSDVRNSLERLKVHWGRFRVGRDFVTQHLPMLNQAAQQLLGRIYDLVLRPLESLLAGVTELTIVPHGPLHQIPFPALFDGQEYLVEHFEISYAPSTTVFLLCRNRQPHPSYRTLVLGVPDPSIPAVREEVMAVARYAPEAEVFLDDQATLDILRVQAAAGANLHLACHGVFRADNPMFSAIRMHDGWLTAAQALQLNLDGALVTLSGCDTGMNQVINGDELLGLTRAFLGAGAASLIVSLWLAQDETTAALMSTLYKHLQDGQVSRAAALRQAQRTLKAEYPHPFYWAPFILVGQREFATDN